MSRDLLKRTRQLIGGLTQVADAKPLGRTQDVVQCPHGDAMLLVAQLLRLVLLQFIQVLLDPIHNSPHNANQYRIVSPASISQCT